MAHHLSRQDVEAFVNRELIEAADEDARRHLLRCPTCQGTLAALAVEEQREQARYDDPIDRALDAVREHARRQEREQARVEELLAELGDRPEAILDITRQRARPLLGRPMIEALLRASFALRYRDPKQMLVLARFAHFVTPGLDEAVYGARVVADTKARVWAELGNALRVNHDHRAADEAFAKARALLPEGTGNPSLEALASDHEAALRAAQRSLSRAFSLLERSLAIYRELGETHLAGRALAQQGLYTIYDDEPEKAVALLEEALIMLCPKEDPRLVAAVRQNRLLAMAEAGHHLEAGQLLLQSGLRQAFADDPFNLLQLRVVEAKIAAGRERFALAAAAFETVRAEFLARDRVYDAALVGLELAAVWLRQGKTSQVRALAAETLDELGKLGVPQEAARALGYLDEACRMDAVSAGLIAGVRRFVVRSRWRAGMEWKAG